MFVSELEVPEDGAHDTLELHLGDVPADTGARPVAERDESLLLAGRQARLLVPALGHKVVGVGAPDLLAVVDGVAGHGEGGARWEPVAEDLDRFGVGVFGRRAGDKAGKTE